MAQQVLSNYPTEKVSSDANLQTQQNAGHAPAARLVSRCHDPSLLPLLAEPSLCLSLSLPLVFLFLSHPLGALSYVDSLRKTVLSYVQTHFTELHKHDITVRGAMVFVPAEVVHIGKYELLSLQSP